MRSKTGILVQILIKCVALIASGLCFALSGAALANSPSHANVTVTRTGDKVIATYTFPTPIREFTFHEILTETGPGARAGDVLRDGSWRIMSEDMFLSAGTVNRFDGDFFQSFSVLISADTSEHGRVYPALVSLGRGVVVGAEYLAAARTQMATNIVFQGDGADVVIAGNQNPAKQTGITIEKAHDYASLDTDEYVVFIGPQEYFRDGEIRAVVDPSTPDWLVDVVVDEATNSLSFFQRHLDETIQDVPTFLISYFPDRNRAGWRGDVSANGLVSMRFKGSGWQYQTGRLRQELSLFVAHEVNHFWNGRSHVPQAGDDNAWLHEGGAEYMALKSLHARGIMSDDELDFLLVRAANRCLQERSTGRNVQNISNAIIYDCGTFAQWVAEASVLASGDNVFDLWRDVFSVSNESVEFTIDDYYRALSYRPQGGRAIEAIRALTEPGWSDVTTIISHTSNLLGIQLVESQENVTTGQLTRTLLVPLLKQYCTPPYSYAVKWTGDRYVVDLENGGSCHGPFSAKPALVSVQGIDFFDQPEIAYDAARSVCDSGDILLFSTLEGRMLLAPCATALSPRAVQLKLVTPWAAAQAF